MSDCIEVTTGKIKGYGYSEIYVGGGRYTVAAHRMAYEMEHGPITNGLHVLHSCDNPACVNVAHLFLGTHADNMKDMSIKGRGRPNGYDGTATHCPSGHEYNTENTWFYPDRNQRICKICRARALGGNMPRKSNDEMIADLEAKLAKAKETAVTRVQTQIEKLEEKKATLTERREKLAVQIDSVNDEIVKLKAEDSFTSVPAEQV